MTFFRIVENKLNRIRENPFSYEKEIQTLTEENLKTIFNFEFVKSEFKIKDHRIDTLAFDPDKKTFIIIEYKRDKNISVVDQGYTYKALMEYNKAEFILEYNENSTHILKRKDVNWEYSKILFIAPAFTKFQRGAIKNKDLPIELWEIKRFENIVRYNNIQTSNIKINTTTIPISSISKIKTIDYNTSNKIPKKQIIYTEQDHFIRSTDHIINLYKKLKDRILFLNDFKIKYNKYYIAFILKSNVIDLSMLKYSLVIFINLKKGTINDSKNLMRDISEIGHWGNGDYDLRITSDEHFDYIIDLVKQSIEKQIK